MMMKQMQVIQFLQRSRSALPQRVAPSLRGISSLSSSPLSSNRPSSGSTVDHSSWTASRQNPFRKNDVYHICRWFASAAADADSVKHLPVKILYGSQGGTAQIFAMQLSEALEEVPGHQDREITVQGLHEEAPADVLKAGEAFYIVLAATAGVGEPTDNARKFHDYLTSGSAQNLDGVHYCVFGLGNQKAHPNHYNVMGKLLDKRLEELGASRVYDLGLGDDGECIEDDYDVWMEGLLQSVYYGKGGGEEIKEENVSATNTSADVPAATAAQVEDPNVTLEACEAAKGGAGKRLVSSKFGRLQLTPNDTDVIRDDMLHLSSDNSFYMEGTQSLPVMSNRPLCASPGENGMYEMRVTLENSSTKMTYETGDHLMVYPQNSQAMVEGFLQRFDVDPHAIIHAPDEANARKHPYPHPTGITLSETLKHCVDLSAVPPPNVARLLLGRQQIDYKTEIANPRRTVLDLVSEASRPFALEEILYNLPPMKARYYSIASSSLVHPNEVYLVYRPVSYTSTRGELRLGVSTSYMKNMMGVEDDRLDDYNRSESGLASSLIGVVNSNPSFRLPRDPKIPVLFIAGGCGIAPIRAVSFGCLVWLYLLLGKLLSYVVQTHCCAL